MESLAHVVRRSDLSQPRVSGQGEVSHSRVVRRGALRVLTTPLEKVTESPVPHLLEVRARVREVGPRADRRAVGLDRLLELALPKGGQRTHTHVFTPTVHCDHNANQFANTRGGEKRKRRKEVRPRRRGGGQQRATDAPAPAARSPCCCTRPRSSRGAAPRYGTPRSPPTAGSSTGAPRRGCNARWHTWGPAPARRGKRASPVARRRRGGNDARAGAARERGVKVRVRTTLERAR